jgi:hypothetical protein
MAEPVTIWPTGVRDDFRNHADSWPSFDQGFMTQHIIWEWANRSGLEHLQLSSFGTLGVKAQGLIVADTEAGIVHFRYSGYWEENWLFRRCGVFVVKRGSQESLTLSRRAGQWVVNNTRRPDLDECVGVDIRDTPFTKTPLMYIASLAVGDICEQQSTSPH